MSAEGVETTEDAFLGGLVHIEQPARGYRAGIDAVLLAATVPSSGPGLILDVGAGVGTVGLCAARRCCEAKVVLLEREPVLANLARGNVERNELANRVRVVESSIDAAAAALGAGGRLTPDSFDVVLANPPYHAHGRGTPAPDALKAVSHAMPESTLDTWVRFMARMTKPGGTATLINKAEALPEVLAACAGRFGALRVLALYPRHGEPASRIIVSGTKGSRAPLTLLPGFVLHGEGNGFTEAASAILRDGGGLALTTLDELRRM